MKPLVRQVSIGEMLLLDVRRARLPKTARNLRTEELGILLLRAVDHHVVIQVLKEVNPMAEFSAELGTHFPETEIAHKPRLTSLDLLLYGV